MDIYKRRGISREDLLLVFSACLFPVYVWSFYNLFNQMPTLISRLDLIELVGAIAYVLAFALVESALFFLVLSAILSIFTFILPTKLFGAHWTAIGSMLAILISAMAMVIQFNFDQVVRLSGRRILFYLGLIGLGFAVVYLLILSFPKIENAIRAVIRRVSVLSMIYTLIGCLSILIVIIRNI